MREYPECRENDRTLMLKVWELQGFHFPKKFIPFFYKVYSPENIRRCRQKFHEQGLYLPDPQKVAQRSIFCMEERQFFRLEKGKRRGEQTTHQPQGFGNTALANSTNPHAS